MNTRSPLLIITVLTIKLSITFSQEPTREFVRAIQDADVLFYFYEDYRGAAVEYEKLLKSNPRHHNLSAKLGICYLNYGDRYREAIPLLRYAAGNTAVSEDDYLEFGNEAPVETLYYLAFAYHISDSLDQAIETYGELLKKPAARGDLRTDYITRQIDACKLAKESINKPAGISSEIYFPALEKFPGAMNPVVSADDSVFLFTWPSGGKTRIYCAFRNGTWGEPADITPQLGGFTEMYTNSVTFDGSFLVVSVYAGASGDLYWSERQGKRWSKLSKFPKPIASKYWEAHGFISSDGQKLLFSSNRPGGMGELDLYLSQRTRQGGWSEPQNLGNVINTPYNETAPFADEKNGTLWFSSEGHRGMGGYDIFRTETDGRRWSLPVMLPYPVNTTGNNTFLGFTPGRQAFLLTPGHSGSPSGLISIMKVEGFTAINEVTITGSVTAGDGIPVDTTLTRLRIVDPADTAALVRISETNEFRTVTTPGNKLLVVESAGYRTDTMLIRVDSTLQASAISKHIILVPEKVGTGEFLTIRSVQFGFDSDEITPEAAGELDRLAAMLRTHAGLNIEVTGYTDSRGSDEYNLKLAGRRASAVVSYLKEKSGTGTDFNIRAAGATGFVAINRNPDGTDNAAGRAYNRRVTIGIVNPGTGMSLTQPVFVPDHLRHPHSGKYGIRLFSSGERFYPDYFRGLGSAEMYFVRPVVEDSLYSYILGDFPSREAAGAYLPGVVAAGFTDAGVISLYEIEVDEPSLLAARSGRSGQGRIPVYTIQLYAGKKITGAVPFRDEPYTILLGNDGLYRYITGEFQGFTSARKELDRLRAAGFRDAFIRELGLLMSQNREIDK